MRKGEGADGGGVLGALRLSSFLLRRRALALLIVGTVSAVLGWSALTLRIDPGVESMIPSGPGDLARLQAFQARFGSDEIVVLAFHSDRLVSAGSVDRPDQLTLSHAHGAFVG